MTPSRKKLPKRVAEARSDKRPLKGRVALVAGATRGVGRGIAVALGEAGATVYCTGRSSRTARSADGAFAADPDIMKKSGRVFSTWGLSDEYSFVDADGSRPHWGRHFEGKYGKTFKACDEGFYSYWTGGPVDTMFADWP